MDERRGSLTLLWPQSRRTKRKWLFMQSCSFATAPMRSEALFSTRLRISSELYALIAAEVFQTRGKHPQAQKGKTEVSTQLFFLVSGPEATRCPPKASERAKPYCRLGTESHESGF